LGEALSVAAGFIPARKMVMIDDEIIKTNELVGGKGAVVNFTLSHYQSKILYYNLSRL